MFRKFEEKALNLIGEKLLSENIDIKLRTLSKEEAIGNPYRDDFPLLKGKEVMIEANFKGSKGQAFTSFPTNWKGKLKDLLLNNDYSFHSKSLKVAAINAVLRYLGYIDKTIHCRDKSPKLCSQKIAKYLKEKYGKSVKILVVGRQPAIIEAILNEYPKEYVIVTDKDEDYIEKYDEKLGIFIHNGDKNYELMKTTNIVLATSTIVITENLNEFFNALIHKDFYMYGVTGAAFCFLMDVNRLCYHGE